MEQRPVVDREASSRPIGDVGRSTTRSRAGSAPSPVADGDIRLTLTARAENVALIRHVIGSVAEAVGFSRRGAEDVRLAVTEACTNVVRHAYPEREPGPLEVVALPGPCRLTVVVTDHGGGIRPNPGSEGAGLGLPLIAALSAELQIDEEQGRGSRVRMEFRSIGSVEPA
jgi:anti-sigma regulatory factor (Ser/Thr protein kinase)